MSDSSYTNGEFCWQELGTRNMAACKDFYAAVAGLRHRDDPMPWGDEKYTTFLTEGGQVGGGYSMANMEQMEGVPAFWLGYVYSDDVDATAARAVELGGSLMSEPMDVPGVCRMVVVRDPAGAMFGLFQPAGHPGMARHGFAPGGFSWFELMTPDVEGAKVFYGGLFGWTAESNPMSNGVEYTSWKLGDQGFGGIMPMDGEEWANIPPHWLAYLTVNDVDAAVAAAVEHGGRVHVPPTDIAEVGRFSMIADPDGAMLSIIAYAGAPASEGDGEPTAAAVG